MSTVTLLALLGGAIILALAGYAGSLLMKLKKQKELQEQHRKLAIQKRNANIFENVVLLCQAGMQEQCDHSELAIRLYCIMDYLQEDDRIDVEKDYPTLSELYHVVKDMPRGDARQELAKQDRMKDNLIRTKAEARLQDAIKEEIQQLHDRIKPQNQKIDIKMI
ncbi:DUF2489 domain-containing protein [Aliivibrio sp. S4TY2]|uniref:DUF2489 domain-containing protein n=1 Tax=unclassified Aliivibrio TaxID=2645654 RepID=UPI0023792E56|nr:MULTISPECIES: DUF2489 domain-containing protein [unclassified Aliivibrio]MDD9156075.1 DUF2489 domain-containing protein [Aliivibrio sp. S4TY2]MDD9159784.1 DUF2489 domain-containing protein [Aliivibrio sp. S4TY1]MDD9163782.1 DUF2489 domain-containing protein [Aliivibrio sp. S4MY2]MDD9167784.1 DUF2489 domain-containing protein [Aliivibrio sp. S4MY4]MDD9185552.1 DUF2489 domain-containing protein [Aliivibrio sp. S4MY3]